MKDIHNINKRAMPLFQELTHIDPQVDVLRGVFEQLKERKNEKSEFRFAELRDKLAQAFPFQENGYDYVAVTDIDPALKDTVLKASPTEIYKKALRGQLPAMDDRNYKHFREDVPEEMRAFLKQFRGEVSRVRFATLKRRMTIHEHIDNDVHHTVRVHVPLITDKYSLFGIRDPWTDEVVVRHLEVGKVYFVNTACGHFVVNGSPHVDRTHLVINLNSLDDLTLGS
jgi:hypothetical protein